MVKELVTTSWYSFYWQMDIVKPNFRPPDRLLSAPMVLLKSKQQVFFKFNQYFNFQFTVITTETSRLSKINLQSSTFNFQLTTVLEPSPSDISVHFS